MHSFNLMSLKFIPYGVFMAFPLLLAAAAQVTDPSATFKAFEAQGWLVAVIAAAMGLVRIALWLRNYKDGGDEGYAVKEVIIQLQEIIRNQNETLNKLAENDQTLSANQQRLTEAQQRLSEAQNRALDNHIKILEALTVFRLHQENFENNLKILLDQIATRSVAELKETIQGIK